MKIRQVCATVSAALIASTALADASIPGSASPAIATLVDGHPLEQVIITARHYENGIGTADAASAGTILPDLISARPTLRPGEVLEFVPGMIVTQHSGDGKANQYFLRGFNLDHGTDCATFVNGLPVNMPTNAHGQGYSDLNFLIPYALDHPATGDQFSQQEHRQIYGLSANHVFEIKIGAIPVRTEVGLQVRQDRIHVRLYDTVSRQVIGTTRDDQVRETLAGACGQVTVQVAAWLRAIGGVRADAAHFNVDSLVDARNSGSVSAHLYSPKFSLITGPFERTEFFVNAGRGFHSNDARGTTAHVVPKSGDPVDSVPELVYVGDAGTTEPNRPSTRRGIRALRVSPA